MKSKRRVEDIVYVLDRSGSTLRVRTGKKSLPSIRKQGDCDLPRDCLRTDGSEKDKVQEDTQRRLCPVLPPCQPYWQPYPPSYPVCWAPCCPPEPCIPVCEQVNRPCPDHQGVVGFSDYRVPSDPEPSCLLSHPISCPVPVLRPLPLVNLSSSPCFQTPPEVPYTPPVRPHCPSPRDPPSPRDSCHSDHEQDSCHSDHEQDSCHSDQDDGCSDDSVEAHPIVERETVVLRTKAISHPLDCYVVRGGGSIHVWGSASYPDLSIESLQGNLELPFPPESRTIYGQLTVFNDIVASSYQGIVVPKKGQLTVVFGNKPIVPIGIPMKGSIHFNLLMSD